MAEKEYLFYLSPERLDRFRYYHVLEAGRVVRFSIEYEALIGGKWRAVVRYDTAHGRPHKDLLHPHKREAKQEFAGYSIADVLTVGERDIKANWQKYRVDYEKELRG